MAIDRPVRDTIEDILRRGGAINRGAQERYQLCHPTGEMELKKEWVLELLDEGSLVTINCGCSGFWWALRPDLVAMRSAHVEKS